MKWIIDYQNESLINDEYYGFIVNSYEYSINCFNRLKKEDAVTALKTIKKNNKVSYLCVDRLIEEDEIEDFKLYLKDVTGLYDYLIFSDMAVLNIFDEGCYGKLIYDPKTLICSSNEYDFYKSMNIDSFIANELSLEEIKKIASKGHKINMMVKGRVLMMYSRRPLLSLYKDFSNNKNIVSNANINNEYCCYYYLKEELRDELYPCVETEHGSFIYSDYIYNAISILDEIKDSVNLARVSLDSFNEGKESIGFLSGSSILLKGGKDE